MKYCKLPSVAQDPPRKIIASQTAMQDENADPALRSAPDVPVKPISGEDIYAEEIIDYLMAHNSVPSDDYNYFNGQPDITEHMRCVLLNWLVDVHLKYRLKADTFFLTVAIIDSFLSKISVNRNELQLVGITALWIAAKYEETYQVPKVNNLVFICDSTYQLKEILQMEGKILLSINFELARITPLVYYDCANRLAFLSPKDYFLGRYLLEAAAFSIDFKRYSQVVLAFSVIFFIRKLRNTQEQPEQILHRKYGLCEKELRACAKELCGLWQKIDYVEAMSGLKNKYSGKGFLEVAKIRISEKSK